MNRLLPLALLCAVATLAACATMERTLPGKPELYDLVNDPMETRNLADQRPDLTRELAGALDAWTHSFELYVAAPISRNMPAQTPLQDEVKVMRGLGYIQ